MTRGNASLSASIMRNHVIRKSSYVEIDGIARSLGRPLDYGFGLLDRSIMGPCHFRDDEGGKTISNLLGFQINNSHAGRIYLRRGTYSKVIGAPELGIFLTSAPGCYSLLRHRIMSSYFTRDEYVEYLKKNCGVRGYDFEERTQACTRPDVDIILKYLRHMDIRSGDKLLEIGCGLGRVLKEIHDSFGIRPHGVDVSSKAIDEARKRVASICGDLRVSPAERIEYPESFFDKVLCWGTFDLTEQHQSLSEFARISKLGGRVMITGKNDTYFEDDPEAHLAEVGARNKGITNHFTDFTAFLQYANELGLDCINQFYFLRRGDFMNDLPAKERPTKFYEFCVIFEKRRAFRPQPYREIGSLFSRTFRQRAS